MNGLTDDTARLAAHKVSRWRGPFAIKEDTSDFLSIRPSDIIRVQDEYYLIKGEAREPRFGLEDEPKWWVKKAQALPDGRNVFIKLVFLEEFDIRVGPLTFNCFRAPTKEARILEMMSGHPGFMQGRSLEDVQGNSVRVVEVVPGLHLDEVVEAGDLSHEQYFAERLPDLLGRFGQAVADLSDLHARGELHGDIRRDHLIVHRDTGRLVWIDFDYTYDLPGANRFAWDLFGLGNVLNYLVMAGVWTFARLRREGYNGVADGLDGEDMNIVFKNYLANPGRLFPYVPERLNLICRRFSAGTRVFYQNTGQLADDLAAAAVQL